MKYVAVCLLSIVSMFSASASTSPASAQLIPPALIAPAIRAAQEVRGAVEDVSGVPDSLLMVTLGGALIALQLRRRQKSLRSPRLAIAGN